MTRNLTIGPPTRLIMVFAIPLVVGNVFQQLYQFTDAIVVGRLVSVHALAAVGASSSILFFLTGLSMGSSVGVAIPVARAFGAGRLPTMRRAVAAGTLISVGIAAFITVVGVLIAGPLLRLLDTPPELMPDATTFLRVSFLGVGAIAAFNFLSSLIRALGDSRTPLYFLVLSCVLNAGLVIVLVGGLHLGVAGAALATVTAQLVSVVLCLLLIARRMPQLHLQRSDWALDRRELAEPLKLGLSMGFQYSIISIGIMVLQLAINGLGADAVAGFTAASRVDMLAVTPLASFGLALATYVAQNRGAQEWQRVRHGVARTTWVALGAAVVLGAIVMTLGTLIVRLFVGSGQDHVVSLAHHYLIINGCLYGFLAILFLYRNAVQGLGNARSPMISGIAEVVLRTTAALVLVRFIGFTGVALAPPLAWIAGSIPTVISWVIARREMLVREEQLRADAKFIMIEEAQVPLGDGFEPGVLREPPSVPQV